jgi:hypothetical protein
MASVSQPLSTAANVQLGSLAAPPPPPPAHVLPWMRGKESQKGKGRGGKPKGKNKGKGNKLPTLHFGHPLTWEAKIKQ